MSITREIGWGPEENALAYISKQFDRLIQVASTISGGGGSGTVTSFSSGNLSPLFTTSVATATTTPALSFALSNAGANTWFGNNTGGSTVPSFNSAGSLTEATSSVLTITGTNTLLSNTTIQVKLASGSQSGYLSSTDWTTFNNKQAAISLTTTGSSGAATFVTNTLNIPTYTAAGLGAWTLASGGTLTGANTITGTTSNTLKLIFASLGTTQTDGAGIYLQNSTAAGAGAQQSSPAITLEGNGWGTTGGASQVVKVIQDILPVQGGNPTITWRLRSSINGAAYSDLLTLNGVNMNFPNGGVLQTGGTARITMSATGGSLTFNQSALSSGWTPAITSTPGAHTALTTATEFISRDFQGATQTWVDGTVTIQRFNYFKAYTTNKTTTSATFTDIYNGYFEKSVAGTSVTFTRNWGIGTNGNLQVQGSAYFGAATTAPTALVHLSAGTASASTAPLKFTSGTNLTTPEAGAVEFDGTNYFVTSSTTRYTVAKVLTATATLDFPNTNAGTFSDLTITVTGAALGDGVSIGVPNGSVNSNNVDFWGWVSATDTVSIRFNNNESVNAVNPASGTFRAIVYKLS